MHAKCYGAVVTADRDWMCDMCAWFGWRGRKELTCALCPVVGGALKVSNVRNDGLTFPQYPCFNPSQPMSPLNPEYLWCHVLCASCIPSLQSRPPSDTIPLSSLKPDLYSTFQCDICRLKTGVCAKCQHRKCEFTVHAECARELVALSRHCGAEEGEIYCRMHIPLKLAKILEERDKKIISNIVNFCHLWEKLEAKLPINPTKRRIRKLCDVEWTYSEAMVLEETVTQYLKKISERQTRPFRVIFNRRSASRSGYVKVVGPEYYNLLDSEAILTESITIPNRTAEECYRYYSLHLQLRMRSELELCRQPIRVYVSKKVAKSRKRLFEVNKRPRLGGEAKDLLATYQR